MNTITKTSQDRIINVLNDIAAKTAAGHPVTHAQAWRRYGEALGHTGETAVTKGREFVDALNAGDVTLEAVEREIAFQSALADLREAADALPPGAFARTTASGLKVVRYPVGKDAKRNAV